MNTYKWFLPEHGGSAADAYEFRSKWDVEQGSWIAEDAAEDFRDHHDGWEASWPKTFTILDENGTLVGSYEVTMVMSPGFYANEVDEG